jgi:hypothetical protein
MRTLIHFAIIFITFFVSFTLTTILSDILDKYSGYYDSGIMQSQELKYAVN